MVEKGQKGAQGIEDGGLVLNGHAYGLCPGYPNPAELELADIGGHAITYGIIGYPGLAKVWLYRSTPETFTAGKKLPAPQRPGSRRRLLLHRRAPPDRLQLPVTRAQRHLAGRLRRAQPRLRHLHHRQARPHHRKPGHLATPTRPLRHQLRVTR